MADVQANSGMERRKDQRFLIKERAIAVLEVGSRFTKLGRVVDVSQGGLAFDYVPMETASSDAMTVDGAGTEPVVLNILSEEGAMALKGVMIQTISDRPLSGDGVSFSAVRTRRCGIQFRSLTDEQRLQLGNFLVQQAVACA